MSDEPTPFRYSRPPIESDGRDALAILSRWIPPRSEVLDLGAATGALGRYLAGRGCEVDGVEFDAVAASAARSSYRSLVEADLETADLEGLFEGRLYDAVVCADVLEHLRDPGRILEQARRLLKADGGLLVSVPNVGYAGVLLDLLAGEFTYRPLGIIDETHLRFYTRPSLLRLLAAHGFEADKFEPVMLSLDESEFGNRMVDRFSPSVLGALLQHPDALVYQFVVRARLNTKGFTFPTITSPPLACFSTQLFWRNGSAPYAEAQSFTLRPLLNSEIHELRFPMPPIAGNTTTLRFDPSDRVGLISLHSLEEQDSAGLRRWRWQAGEGPPPVRPLHQLIGIPGMAVSTFVSLGEDPSFEFLLPPVLRDGEPGSLIIRLSLLPTNEGLAATQGLIEANTSQVRIADSLVNLERTGSKALAVETLSQAVEAATRTIETGLDKLDKLDSYAEDILARLDVLGPITHDITRRLILLEQLATVKRLTWSAMLLGFGARTRARGRRALAALLPKRLRNYLRKAQLKRRSRLMSETGLFDSEYYLRQNPDVAASGIEPIHHYLTFGPSEGRDPHEMFDTSYYLDQNPDVAISGIHPLLHFYSHGLPEGRRPHPSFTATQYRLATLGRLNGRGQNDPAPSTPQRRPPQRVPQLFETRLIECDTESTQAPRDIVARTLVVSHVLPFPPRAGNEYRIHRLVKWLQSIGHEVHLVVSPLPGESLDRTAIVRAAGEYPNLIICERDGLVSFQSRRLEVLKMLSALSGQRPNAVLKKDAVIESGVSARIADLEQTFCPDYLADLLRRLANASPLDMAISNYVFMGRFLPLLSSRIFRVIDTHDVFSTKRNKVARYGVPDSLDISGEEEATLLRRADLIIAIQPNEALELTGLAPGRTVVTAGVDFPVAKGVSAPPMEPFVLYVASNNPLNVRGIRDFLAIAWPLIQQEVPDARMLVVGPVCEAVEDGMAGVDLLGRVDGLEDVYARARVVVNVAIAGTGLKIKTIEAISHLRPIVVWPSGVDGLSLSAQRYCDVAQNWYEFARLVVRQLKTDRSLELMAKREEIEREFSPEIVYAALRAQIEARLGRDSSTEGRKE